jgi:hypothetical protein
MRIIALHDQDGRADGMTKHRSKRIAGRSERARSMARLASRKHWLACRVCSCSRPVPTMPGNEPHKVLLNQVFGRWGWRVKGCRRMPVIEKPQRKLTMDRQFAKD